MFTINEGYRPELIGAITALHSKVYSDIADFGADFEGLVAKGLSEFISRLSEDHNMIWYAEQDGAIIGGISIDGYDLGKGQAHLRWFIVEPSLQSAGLGSKLLQKAMEFCDSKDFEEVHLWTFKGLNAARRLYERNGFVLVEERSGSRYGSEVMEQRFVRRKCS